MLRYILFSILILASAGSMAQSSDSLFAMRKGSGLSIAYRLKKGESVSMIAARFHSPIEKIESNSQVDGRKKLPVGTTLYIPVVSGENFTASREAVGIDHQEPLYFKVGEKDNLALISLFAGVKKQDIVQWNTMKGNNLRQGDIVFIGWMKVIAKDSTSLADGIAYPTASGTAARTATDTSRHAYGELDSLYNAQTRNGTNTISEKGTAAFFEKAGSNKIFYAFHNTSPRGTVIKVYNPGSGKTIYVKVLSTIPETKEFANCIIGISNAAKEALGVTDTRTWCELTYTPN